MKIKELHLQALKNMKTAKRLLEVHDWVVQLHSLRKMLLDELADHYAGEPFLKPRDESVADQLTQRILQLNVTLEVAECLRLRETKSLHPEPTYQHPSAMRMRGGGRGAAIPDFLKEEEA